MDSDVVEIAVVIEMVGLDIRDDGDRRRQQQKRPVAFVGFENDEVAFSQPGIAADRVEQTADNDGGIEARPVQNRRDHRRRRRFSVSAGDRDAVFKPGKFSQHLGARDNGNHCGAGLPRFPDCPDARPMKSRRRGRP